MKEKKNIRFLIADILLLAGAIIPLIFGVVLNILTTPASEGISISGALIYFTIPMPIQDLPITESQVNSALVIISIFFLCLYFTHGLSVKANLKRQLIAEWIVEATGNLVKTNMGEYFSGFAAFVGAVMGLSAFSSLLSLLGLYPPTSDINIVGGWAILVFVLITYYKMKCGPWHYMKSFGEPVSVLLPINIISEFATPVSMAFRHYGNVLSGSVISVLVATGLQGLSKILLGWLPGALGKIPFLQVGMPAVLSIYFDVFSGCLQAFIFAMLTMLYIANGFPEEDYFARKARKAQKIQKAKN
ncbi:MAG: FoF1 ATP synthase subunit a [Acutalibacteraceae bacterium]|nr:FoF1 ATP synthase subunit a [Acutalibacteraceae bacterium]